MWSIRSVGIVLEVLVRGLALQEDVNGLCLIFVEIQLGSPV